MSDQMSDQVSDQEWLVRLQFLEEAQEYLDTIESALLGLGQQKLPREALDGILRAAHSIKGGAALMGFHELSQVAHRLEDFFKVLQGGRYEAEGELERLFLNAVDKMRQMLERCRERSAIDEPWLQENTQPLLDQLYDRLGDPTAADEQATLAADAGGDMGVMLFESEIGPCLDRLEGAMQDPDIPLLRQEFLIACAEMGSLGEMLDLVQFAALCHHGLQLCTDCTDEHLVEVCQAVLKPLRRSHGLVLVDQADFIPDTVPLPKALQAAMASSPAAAQPDQDADTTFVAECEAESSATASLESQAPLDDVEETAGKLTGTSDFTELADCLNAAGALDNTIDLGGIFSLNPQDALAEENSPQDSLVEEDAADITQDTWVEAVSSSIEQPEYPAEQTPSRNQEPELHLAAESSFDKSGLSEVEQNPEGWAVEAIEIADDPVLDSLFEGMTPEDFSLEELALDVATADDITPFPTAEAETESPPLTEASEISAEQGPSVTATSKLDPSLQFIEDWSSSSIESSIVIPSETPTPFTQPLETQQPTGLEAEALVSQFLHDEAFDLEELAEFTNLEPETGVEPTIESSGSSNAQAKAIAIQAEQLTSEMLRESEPEPIAKSNKDTSIRVSVRKLERLGELLGELTTERNGLGLQLGYLGNLFTLLNQRVKSLDSANNILRQSYDRGATQQLVSQPQSASAHSDAAQTSAPQTTQSTANGFDLLEMDQYSELHLVSQEIIESVVQIQEVTSDIELALGETETVSRGLNRTAQQLQVGMNQMRMRPLSAITDRFPRLLRELSMAHDKQVELQVRGGGTLIERTIVEALQDPLMHLLRNCFDHGIEDAETRLAQGKSPQGNIEIGASYRGNQVAITIGDDGAGINLEKIRSKVLTMGLTPAEIEASGDKELVNLIFEPGFSTAEKVTNLSGRGVGMDVVRSNLREIQGDITVATSAGQGSTFTLTVPLSLSVTRVLIVECQGMLMAFPANIVEEMLLLDQQNIVQAAEQNLLAWQGYTVPLLHLQDWLHFVRPLIKLETESTPIIDQSSALIVTHGDEPYAIECDRYWGEQEVTTRTVEGNINLPQGFSGCVVLGDGRVVPLVEMAKLMNWVLRDAQRQDVNEQRLALPVAMSNKRTVLVIDDSINVRRFLSITLEKAGYHVEQAKDGQDAIEKLQEGIAVDVIMSDVEMPRLDGFGFLAQVKSIENCEDIPVVMLTSRSGDKHRQLAMSLGAADYFSKPFKQNELLQTLKQLIDLSTPSDHHSLALSELAAV